jgi:hypothetical protein
MAITDNTLWDEFSEKGDWWLPASPQHRVVGTVKYDPKDGVNLYLDGSLYSFQNTVNANYAQPDIILGQLRSGQKVTLKNNFVSGTKIHFGDVSSAEMSLYSNLMFVGAHLISKKDFSFNQMSVHYSQIEAWLAQLVYHQDHSKMKDEYTVKYSKPDEIDILIPSIRSRIKSETSLNVSGVMSHTTETTLSHQRLISIHPQGKRSLDWFLEKQYELKVFLYFLVGDPILQNQFILWKSLRKARTLEPVFLYFGQSESSSKKSLHPATIPFTYPRIGKQLPSLLNNWFKLAKTANPAIRLLHSAVRKDGPFDQFAFLAYIQALESYHRLVIGPRKMELRPRIYQLLNRQKIAKKSLVTNSRKFVNRLMNSRNYYTHYDAKRRKKALDGAPLYYMSRKLKLLMILVILKKIGITEKEAVDGISRHHELRSTYKQSLVF